MTETETSTKDTTKPYPLPSGATLHLGRPQYGACAALRNALARAGGSRPFTSEEMKLGLDALKETPAAGGGIVQRLIAVIASEDVERALFACLQQATYEPKGAEGVLIKVTPALLDHEDFGDEARTDLYPIFYRVAEVAVKPFLGPLVSAYLAFLKKGVASPASTSPASEPSVS